MQIKIVVIFQLILFFLGFNVFSQDTISIAKKKKVNLIFSTAVEEILLSDETKVIAKTRNSNTSFGQRIVRISSNEFASNTEDYTNLTIICKNGLSFDFTLKTTSFVKKYTWYISDESSSFNINAIKKKQQPKTSIKTTVGGAANNQLYKENTEEYYRLKSLYMEKETTRDFKRYDKISKTITWLRELYYNKKELYFLLEIENKGAIANEISLVTFLTAPKKTTSKTRQKEEIKPLYSYKLPTIVKGKTSQKFVVVFKHFSIDKDKIFLIEINLKGSEQKMVVPVSEKIISNPIRF